MLITWIQKMLIHPRNRLYRACTQKACQNLLSFPLHNTLHQNINRLHWLFSQGVLLISHYHFPVTTWAIRVWRYYIKNYIKNYTGSCECFFCGETFTNHFAWHRIGMRWLLLHSIISRSGNLFKFCCRACTDQRSPRTCLQLTYENLFFRVE